VSGTVLKTPAHPRYELIPFADVGENDYDKACSAGKLKSERAAAELHAAFLTEPALKVKVQHGQMGSQAARSFGWKPHVPLSRRKLVWRVSSFLILKRPEVFQPEFRGVGSMKSTCARFAPVALFLSLLISITSLTLANGRSSSNGTELDELNASVSSTITCSFNNTSALVQITVMAMSTGSAAPASVLVSTNGGPFTQQGTISNWLQSGRDKSAQTVLLETLTANTTTALEICAAQPGSNGNPKKGTCEDISINPTCPACLPAGAPCGSISDCCSGELCEELNSTATTTEETNRTATIVTGECQNQNLLSP
jgi:hypothetical protein